MMKFIILRKEVEFYRAKDGHFYVTAHVHGIPIKFLVDTGATDVILSAEDAKASQKSLKIFKQKENISYS